MVGRRRRRRPGLSQTKTNSAQAGAGARAELGKNLILIFTLLDFYTINL